MKKGYLVGIILSGFILSIWSGAAFAQKTIVPIVELGHKDLLGGVRLSG